MKLLDAKTFGDLVRLLIFVLVTTLATGILVLLIGNISFGATTTYKAVFTDVTGVNKGDDIRVAGVKVGTVQDITIDDGTRARITFTVDEDTPITEATNAAIRYRNLVGQRYITLSEGIGDTTKELGEDGEIPIARTSPALDLTVLFNGFKPLFEALSPEDLNKLSFEVVQVFQGEGGTVESLLGHTASVTNTLAARDEVISALITNLDQVLDHLGDRDDQLARLIVTFKTFVGGLKDDRNAILGSLDKISELSVQTAGLVRGIRQPLIEDIAELRRFASNVDRGKEELDRTLQVLPIKLEKIGRTAIYGSFFNFYLCNFQANVTLPGDLIVPVNYNTGTARCNVG